MTRGIYVCRYRFSILLYATYLITGVQPLILGMAAIAVGHGLSAIAPKFGVCQEWQS